LINLLGLIIVPGYAEMTIASALRWPATLGEIGICLWMLVIGARPRDRAA